MEKANERSMDTKYLCEITKRFCKQTLSVIVQIDAGEKPSTQLIETIIINAKGTNIILM